MKTKTLLLAIIFLNCAMVFAVKPAKTNPLSWAEAVTTCKTELQAKQKKLGFPVESEEVKPGELKRFSVNVTNLDSIVLIAINKQSQTPAQRAFWSNAKLIDKNGSSINLSDLKISGYVAQDKGSKTKSLKLGDVTVENVIITSDKGYISVPLGKKFIRFESELGINDKKEIAVFRVQTESGQTQATELEKRFPNESLTLSAFNTTSTAGRNTWLTNMACGFEKNSLNHIIEKLKSPAYFKSEKQKTENLPIARQTAAYLNLYATAFKILKLQDEVEWINFKAVEMALDDMRKNQAVDQANLQNKLTELKKLTDAGFEGIYNNDATAIESAQKAIKLKKEILFANPLLDMDKIIAGRYKIGQYARNADASDLGTEPANWSCLLSARRNDFNAEITELSNLRGEIQQKTIFKALNKSSLAHIRLHWNADRIMFTMANEKEQWQVYEIDIDGKNLHQAVKVDEPDLEFFDATYLPNEKIISVSNIGYHGVPCVDGGDIVGNMVLFDPKTADLRRITFDQESNWGPIVMNNGRVMYTRWEYTDLTHYFSRIVMHMNPDGTEQKALYGSGSYFPNSTFDIKPLPGNGTRFVGVISGHHGTVRSGRLMIFDPSISRQDAEGITQELPYRGRKVEPIIKDQLVDGVWPQFIKPYPLNENYYLVTAKLNPDGLWGLYLVDTFDNLTLLTESEGEGYIHATPVVKTVIPPMIPETVK